MKNKGKQNPEEKKTEEVVEGKSTKGGKSKTIQFKPFRAAEGIAEPGEVVTLPADLADEYINSGYAFEVDPAKQP